MQILRFDQFEFDTAASEETLRIAIAPNWQFDSEVEFLSQCPREAREIPAVPPSPMPWMGFRRAQEVIQKICRFCRADPPIEPATVAVLWDEWCDLEVLIQTPDRYFWYHWDTTA
jgi:hypothetical protein